jgi:DNA-binding HxlR family transcriptional regulator
VERAGSRALSIFANALSAKVLRAHAEGPLSRSQLEEILAWAPKSSLRAVDRRLCDMGALAEAKPSMGSRAATFELTGAGHELLALADALKRWLDGAPNASLPLDDPAAQGIVRILTAAWESTVIRTLAERPHKLGELDGRISQVNYPSLKRRLAKLHSTGLITQDEAGSRYEVSEWLRRAALPLILAARWERHHDPAADPVTPIEIEAAFLLVLPLIELPSKTSGACALTVLLSSNGDGPARGVAAVSFEASKGRVVSSAAGAVDPPTWALGDADSWLAAVVDGDRRGLRIGGGKPKLAERMVDGIHRTLFAG